MGVFFFYCCLFSFLLLSSCGSTPPRITRTEIDAGVEFELTIKAPSILGAYLPQLSIRARGYDGLKEYTWDLGDDG
jgi:hypothetical protein